MNDLAKRSESKLKDMRVRILFVLDKEKVAATVGLPHSVILLLFLTFPIIMSDSICVTAQT